MKVYIVLKEWAFEGTDVEKVFSTLEKAEEYVSQQTSYGFSRYIIDAFEVDETG